MPPDEMAIEGIEGAKLADLSRCLPFDEFCACVRGEMAPPGPIVTTTLSTARTANARAIRLRPQKSEAVQKFLAQLLSRRHYLSPSQTLFFINEPCYVVPETGVIILNDGRLLLDSIYPSNGEKTVERLVGGHVSRENISFELNRAKTLSDGIYGPVFSRWSNVYFHALTESLAHDFALRRTGLSAQLVYVLPGDPYGTQDLIVQELSAPSVRSYVPIVKVPRVLSSTLLSSYAVLGEDFMRYIEALKMRSSGDSSAKAGTSESIYVSRVGTSVRPMRNESQLVEALQERGFFIFSADGMSLSEQIRIFSQARVIVGPHGSGLTNVAFAQPDATLLEVRPLNRPGESPMWEESYLKLCAVMGFSYGAHVSPNDIGSEHWSVDVDEVVDCVEQIMRPARKYV